MSDIIKTEAVVLSKLNYGDSSSIVSLYTKSDGKISAIIKGGRSPKSKIGKIIDPINHLQIIIYKKNTRDVQILSDASIISYFADIKENLDSTKYSFAIIEIVKNLTAEHESNIRLFNGLVKILNLINERSEEPGYLFGRFLLFFLSEIGYEISVDKCFVCGNDLLKSKGNKGFDYNSGFMCGDCYKSHSGLDNISAELFELIFCLKTNKKIEKLSIDLIDKFNVILERYLKFHITDFKGIQSLQIYK